MGDLPAEGGYRIVLPEFEGPLDLLLHLIKRHELDIFDIPVSFITEKYLHYLGMMEAFNLDLAGEYLLMAATLAYIKSREMLPRKEEDEEDEEEMEDPRAELVRRLLEYQKYRDAAQQLVERPLLDRQVFTRGAESGPGDEEKPQMRPVSSFALIEALAEVMSRSSVKHIHDVVINRITITDRLNELVDELRLHKGAVKFVDCFSWDQSAAQTRHELVITFMAILEMARLGMVRILQHVDLGEIYINGTEALRTVDEAETERSFE